MDMFSAWYTREPPPSINNRITIYCLVSDPISVTERVRRVPLFDKIIRE